MDLPWLPMALSSVAGSLLLVNKSPAYSISASAVKTFLVLETIHILLGLVWKIVIYPKLFSPLRHLPQPKVRPQSIPQRLWLRIHRRMVHFSMGSSRGL